MAENRKTGHRQRLRERFLAGGPESCSDERLLELLLTFAIGRKNVRPLAQELVQIFGNLDHILSASPDELYKVKGLGQSSIALLKVVDFIAEIDAYVAHLYGLSRDDFAYILDTFPVLKKKEKKAFGEFMSKRKCLEEYDRIKTIMNAEG